MSVCNQTFSSSALIKETVSTTWVLDNFTNLTGLHDSPEFATSNKLNLSFQLGLHLNLNFNLNFSPYTGNVFIFLRPLKAEKLNLEYEVSILDSQDKKCYTKIFQFFYNGNIDYSYCFASLINYHDLINEASGFIPGNKLTLFCQVNILHNDSDVSQQIDAKMPKLSLDLQTIFESGDYSDFALVLGEKEFKVHKNVLAARSSVFKAMFSADLEEKKQNRVEIKDIDVEVFEQLLAYIYSGGVQKMDEFALELFVAADKYQLDELKSQCAQSLISTLTIETVANILLHADMHTAAELKSKCIKFITANSAKVMATDGWKQLIKSKRMELMEELYADKC